MPNSTLRGRLAALAAASFLAACGGGGGDSGGGGTPDVAPRVAIVEANAPSVAAQALDAGSVGFIGDSLLVGGVQVDTSGTRPVAITRVLRTAAGLVRTLRPSGALVTGVAIDETFSCTGGGSVRVTGTAADANLSTIGDAVTFAFNNCVEAGSRVNGTLAMVLTDTNAAATRFTATATATNLSGTVLGVTERVNGSLRIHIDETAATTALFRVTSTRFDFDRIVAGVTRASRSLLDYDYSATITLATGSTSETLDFVATGDFRVIGKASFVVTTATPVVTAGDAEHPGSGALRVTGAAGSTLLLSVTATGVQIDLDADGNGTVDRTLVRTWEQIDGEL